MDECGRRSSVKQLPYSLNPSSNGWATNAEFRQAVLGATPQEFSLVHIQLEAIGLHAPTYVRDTGRHSSHPAADALSSRQHHSYNCVLSAYPCLL